MNNVSTIRRIARSLDKKAVDVGMQYIGYLNQDDGLSVSPTVSVSI
jgi:hypothetical protein